MFRTYIKTAFRFLQRNKAYTVINTAGLSAGIAMSIILFLIIRFELSFDRFHTKQHHIYRVLSQFMDQDGLGYGAGVPGPLPGALRRDFPQVQKVAVISTVNNVQFQAAGTDPKIFREESGVFYTEPAFFDIFDFTWIAGTAASLGEPNNIVLTEDIAQKYFGSPSAAMGKFLTQGGNELKVTGILGNVPPNTDFQFKYIISYTTLKNNNLRDWETISSNNMCYLLLPPGVQPASINLLFPAFLKKYKKEGSQHVGQLLQPLNEVHFDTQTSNFLRRTVSLKLITVLELIGIFILLIACMNFINLSTAQSLNRAKEVGVRKVLGSGKIQLMIQFYYETALIVLCSMLLGLVLADVSLSSVNNLLQLPLQLDLAEKDLYIFLPLLFLSVVFLAGFYPALVLSGFNVIAALKSRLQLKSANKMNLRKTLIIMQFVIAQVLVIGTLVTVKQMRYFHTASMGFNREAVMKVSFPGDSLSLSKLDAAKTRLLANSNIKQVSFSFGSPAEKGSWQSEFAFSGNTKPTDFAANLKWADGDYINTYGLQVIAGRNYRQGDTTGEIIVSEELVKKLGLSGPAEILNKEISFWDGTVKVTVVGVIKDFHSRSLHEPIAPVIIGNRKSTYRFANIRLHPGNIHNGVAFVEKLWKTIFPETVFDYHFVDDTIEAFYLQEQQLTWLYELFSGIAIFLSCLGLYGLISFMAIQRRKEVGIRKVLGASPRSIFLLFSKEFVSMVLIAFVIAGPVAFYVMSHWLQDFTYRTALSWWLFALGGLLTLVITLITISFQAMAAALSNPVKNIRTE